MDIHVPQSGGGNLTVLDHLERDRSTPHTHLPRRRYLLLRDGDGDGQGDVADDNDDITATAPDEDDDGF